MRAMPDFLAKRPTPTAEAAVASLIQLGIDPAHVDQIPVSPLESFKGEVVGQVPHPGTAIDENTAVVLYVARDGLAERLPHDFLEPLPTTEDDAHVALEPGQIMEFWERQVAAYRPGRRFVTVIDRALGRLNQALDRIRVDISSVGQDPSFAWRVLDLMGYGDLPLSDDEARFLAARIQTYYARFGVIGGLTLLLESLLDLRVEVVEAVAIPGQLPEDACGRLGQRSLRDGFALGPVFADPKPRLRVRLGPVRAAEHEALDSDARWHDRVHALVSAMMPADQDWGVELVLDRRDRGTHLGDRLLSRLGRSSYLAA